MSLRRPARPTKLNATAASVLGFLSLGPLTGWDLNALAQVSVGHFWNMTRSQIYRELNALAALGFVEVASGGPRNTRRHRLSDAGRSALHDWLAAHDVGETMVRNPALVRLFFAAEMTADERRALIETGRARSAAKLATLERLAREHGSALGLAGPLRPVTIERLAAWARDVEARGYELVPVSALVVEPNR